MSPKIEAFLNRLKIKKEEELAEKSRKWGFNFSAGTPAQAAEPQKSE